MCSNVNLMTEVIESEALSAEEEAFAGKLTEMVNHGMAGLMIAIGHRTGLFSALCARVAGRDGDIGHRSDRPG